MKKNLQLSLGILIVILCSLTIYYFFYHFSTKPHTLLLNLDQSDYSTNQLVTIYISSINTQGHPDCDSKLELSLTDPAHTTSILSLTRLVSCDSSVSIDDPDYLTTYTPTKLGTYTLTLKNLTTKKHLSQNFVVNSPGILSIQRSGSSRFNPGESRRYPMIITVTALADYEGTVVEQLSPSLNVVWFGTAELTPHHSYQTLSWQIKLKRGETITLAYEYTINSDAKSQNLKLGPLTTQPKTSTSYWHLLRQL